MNYLMELLKNSQPEQEIIWVNFRQEAEALKHLPSSDLLIGDIPLDRQMDIIKDFKAGNLQYIIANQKSISHGLTFVNSHLASYFSQNYSYELAKQSADRQNRIGQKHTCYLRQLLAKNTVDKVIYKANIEKGKMVDKFFACLVDIQNGVTPKTMECDNIFNVSHSQSLKKGIKDHLKG